MNTSSKLPIIAAALLSVTASSFAAQTAPQPKNAREGGQPAEQNRFVTAAGYPFRAAYSIVRTPLIVGETFTGKRTFMSKRGLFMKNETEQAENTTQSVENRGESTRSTRSLQSDANAPQRHEGRGQSIRSQR